MNKIYNGDRYSIELCYDDKDLYLAVAVTELSTGRKSSVMNLNCILGILPDAASDVIEDGDVQFEDKTLYKMSKKALLKHFEDEDWIIKYLEPALDEDRAEGEWGGGGDEDDFEF